MPVEGPSSAIACGSHYIQQMGIKISLFLCSDVQVKGETSVHNEVFAFVIQSASVVLQSGMAHKVKNENGTGEENF